MPLRSKELEPYVPWEILRNAYSSRFGDLVDAYPQEGSNHDTSEEPGSNEHDTAAAAYPALREAKEDRQAFLRKLFVLDEAAKVDAIERGWTTAPVVYQGLWFCERAGAGVRYVVATFGAAPYTGGHELFATSMLQIGNLTDLLVYIVKQHAPLRPGTIVPVKRDVMGSLPFVAALLLPAGAGTFSFGMVSGSERYALQVVPLTAPEMELAERSLDELIAALERIGAVRALDPMRDCVVSPDMTRRHWARQRLKVRERMRQLLTEGFLRRRRLHEAGAPQWRLDRQERKIAQIEAIIGYLKAKRTEAEREEDAAAQEERMLREIVGEVYREVRPMLSMLPAELNELCPEIFGLAMLSHPHAVALVQSFIEEDVEVWFDPEGFMEGIVETFPMDHPQLDPGEVAEAARAGHEAAKRARLSSEDAVRPHVAWTFIVQSVYDLLQNDAAGQGARCATAVAEGIRALSDELSREEPEAHPYDRIVAAARELITKMSLAYYVDRRVEKYCAKKGYN